jgi:hypothetical protein
VPVSDGVILHYESCDFNQWCAKFRNQVDCTPERKQSIPFPYYRDSITLFQQHGDPLKDRDKWVEFYTRRKINHYNTADIKTSARHIGKLERPCMIDLMPGLAEALAAARAPEPAAQAAVSRSTSVPPVAQQAAATPAAAVQR